MFRKVSFLKDFYLSILIVIIFVVIGTPYIVRDGISFLDEEIIEVLLIGILILIGYIILRFYRSETNKVEEKLIMVEKKKRSADEKLEESFKYIGSVNLQIQAIKDVMTGTGVYPHDKHEMKYILNFLGAKALSIVSADWILIRIIDMENMRTLREYIKTRGSAAVMKHTVSNRELVEEGKIDDCEVVSAHKTNFAIKAFIVFPDSKLTEEQKIMLSAIAMQLEMLFIIFKSQHYK